MTQNYDELLKRLDNDSRYSQGNCLKCAKGFENHEYHCWGPETEGCMASQKELQITVLQWKKERKQASTAIRTLQAERDAAYARGFSAALEAAAEYMNSFENCDEFGEAYAAASLQLKRPEL